MVRKLKNLALLVGALLALGGLTSSVANAANFTVEEAGTTVTGFQEGQFTVLATNLTMSCEITEFHGVAPATSFQEMALATVLTQCKTNLGTTVTVTRLGHHGEENFCHLVAKANNTGDLVCPPGADVTADAGPCLIHIPPQSGISSFSYTNTKFEGKSALTIDVNIGNIHGTHTDGFLCPFNGGGTFANTKVEGVGLIVGESQFGEPTNITWDE